MSHLIKLYVHAESDLFRTVLFPSARRRLPETRPPWLTPHQLRLWQALSCFPKGETLEFHSVGIGTRPCDRIKDLRQSLTHRFPEWKIKTFDCIEDERCWRIVVSVADEK